MVMRPYFGMFADQWLTFDLRRSESMVSIKANTHYRTIRLSSPDYIRLCI